MKRLALVAALAALIVPASAHANGDPASDVLITDHVFIPFEAPVSKAAASDLTKTVSAANSKGYKIRVAVIAFSSDLGTAVSLWKHPQDYAKFLGKEDAFAWTGPLLVAMPAGYGYYDSGKPVEAEIKVLSRLRPGQIPTDLAESTAAAVRELAAAKGIKIAKPVAPGSSATHDRLILGAAVAAFVVILLIPARLVRRRARGGERSPSAGPR